MTPEPFAPRLSRPEVPMLTQDQRQGLLAKYAQLRLKQVTRRDFSADCLLNEEIGFLDAVAALDPQFLEEMILKVDDLQITIDPQPEQGAGFKLVATFGEVKP